MKTSAPDEFASRLIDEKISGLGDWRGKTLAKLRAIILTADPQIVEQWKWGTPVWSRGGIVTTGETYKNAVKLTFANGAALEDPSGLFNSSLDGNVRRAIDVSENEKLNEAALQKLVRAAVAFNLGKKTKPEAKMSPEPSSKRVAKAPEKAPAKSSPRTSAKSPVRASSKTAPKKTVKASSKTAPKKTAKASRKTSS